MGTYIDASGVIRDSITGQAMGQTDTTANSAGYTYNTAGQQGIGTPVQANISGGIGSYGTYTSPNGQVSNLDQTAYDAVNNGGAIDGTLAKSSSGLGGLTGTDYANISIAGLQGGIGYLDYLNSRKGMESTIGTNKANLDMAKDQLYVDGDSSLKTKRDAVASNLSSAFNRKS